MSQRTILVTGSTDGIGRATALELARRGERVILHGRNLAKVQQARDELAREVPGSALEVLAADFSALAQVRAAADEVAARFPRLDVLINNAGISMRDRQLSVDGFELTFAVNHLAVFLLTNRLLGLLQRSAPARVVTVSSMLHINAKLDFENLQGEKFYSGGRAYATSKLANVLFTVELAERVREKGITVNCLHPGAVDTKLLRSAFPSLQGITVVQGAVTSVYLACSPEVAQVSGEYFDECRPAPRSPLASDPTARQHLWQLSEQLTAPWS